ncbi:hypothetical protein JCM11641_007374 [Rhodosporidiobolus odoratus]
MSTLSPLGQPSSLEAALARIHFLENRWERAKKAVKDRTGEDIDVLLELDAVKARPPISTELSVSSRPSAADSPSLSAASHSPPVAEPIRAEQTLPIDAPADGRQQTERVDIAPLALLALQLRKDLHGGKVAEEDAETELATILEKVHEELSEEQMGTVRMWAGMRGDEIQR